MRSPNNIYDIFKCLLCHVQSNFILLMRKKHIFFLETHTTFVRTFYLDSGSKVLKNTIAPFFNHKLTCTFSGKSFATIGSVSFYSFFPFCYRLVRTYVREHISVFNKNDRRNLFLSAHIIFSVGMLLTKHPNGWKFCGIMVRAAFWQIRASDKINKNHFVCLLACFAFQS